jgi:hypothetical protein
MPYVESEDGTQIVYKDWARENQSYFIMAGH